MGKEITAIFFQQLHFFDINQHPGALSDFILHRSIMLNKVEKRRTDDLIYPATEHPRQAFIGKGYLRTGIENEDTLPGQVDNGLVFFLRTS